MRGYYSKKQEQALYQTRSKGLPVYRFADGAERVVTQVGEPPNFDDVVDLGEVVEFVRFGRRPKGTGPRFMLPGRSA